MGLEVNIQGKRAGGEAAAAGDLMFPAVGRLIFASCPEDRPAGRFAFLWFTAARSSV